MSHPLYMTAHALERFQEHHEGASFDDMLEYVRYGKTVDAEEMRQVLSRPYAKRRDNFVLSPDYRGCFVIQTGSLEDIVVTYLRFDETRQERVRALWPM